MILDVAIIVVAVLIIALGLAALNSGSPRRLRRPTPAEQRRDQFVLGQREQRNDAEYEAMTPAQRDAYYVHPNLWVRWKRFWRG